MAALNRPTTANYEVHENVRVDTQDNEDHTFCGVLFPIKIKEDLPVSQLVLYSVAVRGRLGPMTVWISNEDAPTGVPRPAATATTRRQQHHQQQQQQPPQAAAAAPNNGHSQQYHFRLHQRYWTKIYEKFHKPSIRQYQTLDFSDNPVILKPGMVRAIYIHSSLPGDEAIVYDNTRHQYPNRYGHHGGGVGHHWGSRLQARHNNNGPSPPSPRYEDPFVAIYTGKSHLSTTPFGNVNIWGWDNAWRDYREFVGQLRYGTTFQLWQPNPTLHGQFGSNFDACTRTLLALQRRANSPVSMLPDECLFYILNMCRWDWFQDTSSHLKAQRRKRKILARAREQERQQAQQQRKLEQEEIERQQQQQQQQPTAVQSVDTTAVPAKGSCSSSSNSSEKPPSLTTMTTSAYGVNSSSCNLHQQQPQQQQQQQTQEQSSFEEEDAQFFDTHQELPPPPQQQRSENEEDDDESSDSDHNDGDEVMAESEDDDYTDTDDLLGSEEDHPDADDDDIVQEDDDDDDDDENYSVVVDGVAHPRMDPSYFTFRYASSDEEEEEADDNDDDEEEVEDLDHRHQWFRRHFPGIHIGQQVARANAILQEAHHPMHLD